MTIYWALLILSILLSAFFSASEAAFLSIQRVKLRHMVDAGVPGAQRMARLIEHPGRFLPTVLVGNNLVNTSAATFGTIIAIDLLRNKGIGALVATIGVAVLLVVFGESIPKTIGSRLRERLALPITPLIFWMERLFLPFVAPLQHLNRWVSSRTGGEATKDMLTREELSVLISLVQESGAVQETEAEMLLRMLRAIDRQVGEIATPRTEIVWVEEGMTLNQFLEFNARQFHSRFPIFDGNVDNVVGKLATEDVLQAMGRGELEPSDSVTKLMRPAYFVPETKRVTELITEMRERGANMALVVNEFGEVVGVVTFKQLVEEIVGEVKEAGDEEPFRALDAYTTQVRGNARIDDLNEKLGLGLPEGDYETVAGFVLKTLGRVPEKGERLHHQNLEIVITKMRGPRVEEMRIIRPASSKK